MAVGLVPETHHRGNPDRAEHRWPAVGAALVALALYAFLPSDFEPILRIVVVAVCLAVLVVLIIVNPHRMRRQTTWSRWLSIGLVAVLGIANYVAFVQLILMLIEAEVDQDASLLLASAQVWGTNVVVYALLYWELDRGGPVTRSSAPRTELPRADIRFPQDENGDAITEVASGSSYGADWTAGFIDYLYVSASNSMSFSPPDAVPLTTRMKIFFGLQALSGFVLLVLVIARAVALLGGGS